MISSVLALLIIWPVLVISPGPDMAIVLRQTLQYGEKAGMATAAGVTVGIIIYLIIAILGLETIYQHKILFNTVTILGSGYLFYLAGQNWASTTINKTIAAKTKPTQPPVNLLKPLMPLINEDNITPTLLLSANFTQATTTTPLPTDNTVSQPTAADAPPQSTDGTWRRLGSSLVIGLLGNLLNPKALLVISAIVMPLLSALQPWEKLLIALEISLLNIGMWKLLVSVIYNNTASALWQRHTVLINRLCASFLAILAFINLVSLR